MAHRSIQDTDREAVAEFVERHWGSRVVMSGGLAYHPHEEAGFVEQVDGQIVGLLTYRIEDGSMEVLTLNATLEGKGIGSSLMLTAIDAARAASCRRIWLTTTNDNLRAIGFYQRLAFRMVEINVGVVDEARKVKPQIPITGQRGIEIHDEIVMELQLKPYIEQGAAESGESC